MVELASDPDGLLAVRDRLVELAQLGEAPGQPPEGGRPSRPDDAPKQIDTPIAIAPKRFRDPPEALGARSILPLDLPDHAQILVQRGLEGPVVVADGESALASLERAVGVPDDEGARGVPEQGPPQSALVAQRLGEGLGLAGMLGALGLGARR